MIVGIGCDIVEIKRLKKNQEVLAKRILSEKEYLFYQSYKEERRLEFLAGRFAAREAVVKAMDQKLLLSDIEILYDEMGKPTYLKEGYSFHISIAHEQTYAIAYVICEK